MPRLILRDALFLGLVALCSAGSFAQENNPATAAKTEEKKDPAPAAATGPLPGHSFHAEVFNEGPRHTAYLMQGMPKIVFPVTTKVPDCQPFICQGLGQVHGLCMYEAESFFR